MKTLLQMEMYYVREYTPTCRFLKIINSTPLIIFKNLQLGVYSPLHRCLLPSSVTVEMTRKMLVMQRMMTLLYEP
jgi:hypothetical protein